MSILLKLNCVDVFKWENKDSIVGVGAVIFFRDTAWLAMIIVRADARGSGLGTEITRFLIQKARDKKAVNIKLIATEMGEPLYAKLGFEPEGRYLFYRKPGEFFFNGSTKGVHALNTTDISSLYALDFKCTGEDRSAFLESFLQDAHGYSENGILTGFYLPRAGEGLVVASTETAALHCMNLRNRDKSVWVFPEQNELAQSWVSTQHWEPFRQGMRMSLGEKSQWKPEWLYARISGQVG
ncbi:MAG: GNAT family N-acetyltransferase [Bacteroidetes bacterium]|nr:GNAT family N-acetyltransferase [Bacteroidota bacterium]